MTKPELQAEITKVNSFISSILALFPQNPVELKILTLLKQVETNPFLQDLALLWINHLEGPK